MKKIMILVLLTVLIVGIYVFSQSTSNDEVIEDSIVKNMSIGEVSEFKRYDDPVEHFKSYIEFRTTDELVITNIKIVDETIIFDIENELTEQEVNDFEVIFHEGYIFNPFAGYNEVSVEFSFGEGYTNYKFKLTEYDLESNITVVATDINDPMDVSRIQKID